MRQKGFVILFILFLTAGCAEKPERETPWPQPAIIATPQSSDFNLYFRQLGEEVGVLIPYEFKEGDVFDQQKVNENFDAILEGLWEMKQKMAD